MWTAGTVPSGFTAAVGRAFAVAPAAPAAPMTTAEVDSTGPSKPSPEAQEIRATIRSRMSEFLSCFDRHLEQHPESAAVEKYVVVLEFFIGEDGRVATIEKIEVTPALDDAGFRQCVTDLVRTLQFARARKVQVRYPLTFRPRGKK
ncbi:AgmX/PglI C-terminal domain-containing protein [Haliangium sp.]|uniref:AgmX/PglI C-terminal domain-containing protein n=1 Tax=Haliangium sp. TaxID=2663208 RepID=UPI003D0E97DF